MALRTVINFIQFKYKRTLSFVLLLFKRKLYLLLLIFPLSLYSQNFSFRHYTAEDGLPSSEVYHVFQDSKGYIWFATDNGVSRYDGYEFHNFSEDDGLPDNTVFEIYEDYKGRIWFIPHSAMFSYFFNDSIFHYKFNHKLQETVQFYSNPFKGSFAIDSTEKIYYGDRRNGSFYIDSIGKITAIHEEKNFHAVIGINERFIINRPIARRSEKKKFAIVRNGIEVFSSDTNGIFSSSIKKQDNFFILNNNNNDFFVANDVLVKIKNLTDTDITSIPSTGIYLYVDDHNNLWVGTRSGVLFFKNSEILDSPNIFLKNRSITSILKDHEGGFWFTTLLDGAYYIPNLSVKYLNNDPLFNKGANSLYIQNKKFWIASNNSLYEISSETKTIQLDKENIIIKKIHYDSLNNKMWILSRYLYSIQNNEITKANLIYKNTFINSAQPKDIIVNRDGKIWIATSRGLYKFVGKNDFITIKNNKSIKINAICFNQDENIIYCGTNDGLWQYRTDNNSFEYVGDELNLSSQIECILKNKYQQNIWFGTKSDGIKIYSNDTVALEITTNEGLSSNSITTLNQIGNIIWVGTINGLNKIELGNPDNILDYSITNYSKIHGLLSNEIQDVFANDTVLFIASKKGVNLIKHKNLTTNKTPPNIYFKNIKILDKDTIVKDYYELPYNQNSIYIEYAGLMYRNNAEKRYKYKLNQKGEDSNWKETNDNFLRLSFLPAGSYYLKVKAINEDGVESTHPAELNFTINPPFWKTWWFSSLLILFIVIITYFLFKSRVNELNKRSTIEKNLLKEVNKFRQQALSQQMNPHFIFNTLNSIQFFIYENNNDKSVHYLSKFAKLMRTVLENSQYETISIQKELNALALYLDLESLRFKDGFNYKIDVSLEIDPEVYHIYPLILQPYIENSIWHGLYHKQGEKNLLIKFENNDENFLCIIEDDGVGREKSFEINKNYREKHKSLGTKITNKRIEAINKLYNRNFSIDYIDLKDQNGAPSGTRVLLRIPKITD